MPSETQSPYMSSREAADYWRVSTDTIHRWAIKHKWRKDFNPDGRIVFYREDVLRTSKAAKES